MVGRARVGTPTNQSNWANVRLVRTQKKVQHLQVHPNPEIVSAFFLNSAQDHRWERLKKESIRPLHVRFNRSRLKAIALVADRHGAPGALFSRAKGPVAFALFVQARSRHLLVKAQRGRGSAGAKGFGASTSLPLSTLVYSATHEGVLVFAVMPVPST